MAVVTQIGGSRKLDRLRPFATMTGMVEGARVVGYNKDGEPLDGTGRVVPNRNETTLHVQDGQFFADNDELYPMEDVPVSMREEFERKKAERPEPGITHPAKLVYCPAPGCHWRGVATFFDNHRRTHDDLTETDWNRLLGQGPGTNNVPYRLEDFANPSEVAASMGVPQTPNQVSEGGPGADQE